MQFAKLQFRPGIIRDLTEYSSTPSWRDCNLVRFRNGYPETIGGWVRANDNPFLGICRSMFEWVTLQNERLIGIGTSRKYYVMRGSTLFDVTPIRETTGPGEAKFSATNGSSVVTVNDTNHVARVGDYVIFSNAVGLGGAITASVLNAEHRIVSIDNTSSYKIDVGVQATSADTGDGGSSTVAEYQVTTGNEVTITGPGWGSDGWGVIPWGGSGSTSIQLSGIRIWSHDNYGEDLVINPSGLGIYYWDSSLGFSNRAVNIVDLPGIKAPPTVATQVMVSNIDRHVIAFGCDDEFSPGIFDPLLIRFSDQENIYDWSTSTTNTAGSIRLSSGTSIVSAIQTRREIIIFTDKSMFSMQFIGPPYTFGVSEISVNTSIASRNAVIAAHDVLYWMGHGKFLIYDGTVREIPCPVRDHIFGRMDRSAISKVAAGHNEEYSEIWWFYQSMGAHENDSYVVYNYQDNVWYYGSLGRTATLYSDASSMICAGKDGYIYYHDVGYYDGSTSTPAPIHAYIESSGVEIGDGYNMMYVERMIPDVSFLNREGSGQSVGMTAIMTDYPGDVPSQSDGNSIIQTFSTSLDNYTREIFPRLRGRAMSLRFESNSVATGWRIGIPRVSIRPDGRRS